MGGAVTAEFLKNAQLWAIASVILPFRQTTGRRVRSLILPSTVSIRHVLRVLSFGTSCQPFDH